ncbi:hypothetical protein BJ991_003223 [Microbacterium immunditiarum]|uniref:Uncharacterized protein n=1 Tax=Microbacterium immunditiarum TaxID=337480 RepID=A0A7Y9GR67_9MICO|nr:hypothetical protein [Microbacterium immunditiarum]
MRGTQPDPEEDAMHKAVIVAQFAYVALGIRLGSPRVQG